MIKSMTGYGRGRTELNGGAIVVEIKTVNHKFFEMAPKIPTQLAAFEDRIKDLVQKRIKRGKVNLNLVCEGVVAQNEKVVLNERLAKSYYGALGRLQKVLGMGGAVSMRDIITLPGVVGYESREESLIRLWPKVKATLQKALRAAASDRTREGGALYKDMCGRARRIRKMLGVIRGRARTSVEEYKGKFAQRVRQISGGQNIDAQRLAMEVAIYAKNCDISEEITRLDNHLANFTQTLSEKDETGKKLDFIAQELHREINTIGAKASDFGISRNVIDIKSEIEKIREQVKNIE